MIRLAVLAAAAVSMVILAGAASAASPPQLVGVVGQNNAFKITLSSGGKVAKTLKAGTYTLVVHDDSAIHNYELDGPHGKSWTFTSISQIGTKTITLKLTPGKYKAYCAAHEPEMFQHFTVT